MARVSHLHAVAKRKQRLPPQSYEHSLSKRTAEFLRRTCGSRETSPPQVRRWLLDGTLRLYGHNFLMFKGIKTQNAGRATFFELCDYAKIDAAEVRRLKSTKILPPSQTILNKSIAILERAGYKITGRKRTRAHKAQRARQTPRKEGSQYMVYAIKEQEAGAKPYPQQFASIDEAARTCITLREQGYKILGVRLPDGNYIMGAQIEWSIRLGVSSVKIALGVS